MSKYIIVCYDNEQLLFIEQQCDKTESIKKAGQFTPRQALNIIDSMKEITTVIEVSEILNRSSFFESMCELSLLYECTQRFTNFVMVEDVLYGVEKDNTLFKIPNRLEPYFGFDGNECENQCGFFIVNWQRMVITDCYLSHVRHCITQLQESYEDIWRFVE